MEIRCSSCGHVGPASSIANTEAGIELICAHCGHANSLAVPPAQPTPTPVEKAKPPKNDWLSGEALERLIPTPGPGPRCQKCATLLNLSEDSCRRCGLANDAAKYALGEAPWEAPAPGKEAATAQALLLWGSVEDNPHDDNLRKFFDFALHEELLELGIRRLRFFLVDHPEHELAVSQLKTLAQSFQAKALVVRAQAEVRADNIVAKTVRARQVVLWLVLVVFGGVFLLFLFGTLGLL